MLGCLGAGLDSEVFPEHDLILSPTAHSLTGGSCSKPHTVWGGLLGDPALRSEPQSQPAQGRISGLSGDPDSMILEG